MTCCCGRYQHISGLKRAWCSDGGNRLALNKIMWLISCFFRWKCSLKIKLYVVIFPLFHIWQSIFTRLARRQIRNEQTFIFYLHKILVVFLLFFFLNFNHFMFLFSINQSLRSIPFLAGYKLIPSGHPSIAGLTFGLYQRRHNSCTWCQTTLLRWPYPVTHEEVPSVNEMKWSWIIWYLFQLKGYLKTCKIGSIWTRCNILIHSC